MPDARRRTRIAPLAVGAALVAVAVALVLVPDGDEAVVAETRGDEPPASVSAAPLSRAAPAAEAPRAEEPRTDARVTVAAPALTGRVVASGEPIADAEVLWLVPAGAGVRGTASARTRTDTEGVFSYPNAPELADAAPSALWVAHPAHRLALLLLEATAGGATSPRVVLLEPAPGTRVRVVDTGGEPVAATVERTIAPESADDERTAAARASYREAHVRAAGEELRLADPLGRQILTAYDGERRSVPWIGEGGDEVELTLRATFELSGSVVAQAGPLPEGLFVDAFAADDDGEAWLGALSVEATGAFGPARLALPPSEHLRLHLRGPLHALDVRREAPAPGERVHVELEAGPGITLGVRVVDEDDAPVPDARVGASWGDWWDTGSRMGTSDESGAVELSGCRPGLVTLGASKDGFAPARVTRSYHEDDPGAAVLRLTRAGTVSGRVVHAGEPVRSFEIVHFRETAAAGLDSARFEDEEGRFLLEDVSLGDLTLYAVSPDHAQGPAITIEVVPDGVDDLVLEVLEGHLGRGRILDGETRRPLPGATIDLYTATGGQLQTHRGITTTTGPDGTFEIPGLPPTGRVGFCFRAEGYGVKWWSHFASDVAVQELGDVVLFPLREFQVVLIGLGDASPSEFSLDIEGPIRKSFGAFPESGVLTVEDCVAGRYGLWLTLADGSEMSRGADLKPNQPWRFEFDLATGREVRVVLEGEDVPPAGWLRASFAATEKYEFQADVTKPWRSDGGSVQEDLRGLGFGPVYIEAFQGSRLLASGMAGPEDTVVYLETGAAQRFRVVDARGRPIPAADVTLMLPDVEWVSRGTTNADGEVEFGAIGASRVLVDARHAEHGSVTGVSVSVDPSRTIELPLVADSGLRVRCLYGEEPVSGVLVALCTFDCFFEYALAYTDSDGRVSFDSLGAAAFEVNIAQPGHWPVEEIFEATPERPEYEVQLRRLVDVQVRVRDESGAVLGGVLLELTDLQTGRDVVDWVQAESVTAVPDSLVTSPTGTVQLTGLPTGTYAWRVATASGSFAVTAQSPPVIDITVEF